MQCSIINICHTEINKSEVINDLFFCPRLRSSFTFNFTFPISLWHFHRHQWSTTDKLHNTIIRQHSTWAKQLIFIYLFIYSRSTIISYNLKLEGCIDDEHQFKTAKRRRGHKRLETPLFWNCFSTINLLFFIVEKNSIFGISEFFYMCLYANFQFSWWLRDHFLAPFRAYICQMPGHRLSRLAKGTPSESQLSISTIGLG